MKKNHILFCLILSCIHPISYSQVQPVREPREPTSEMLVDWIALQLGFVRTTKGITQGHVVRQFSLNGIAFYEALVNGQSQYHSLAGQLQQLSKLPAPPFKDALFPVTANATYAAMLRVFFGSDMIKLKKIDSLEVLHTAKFTQDGLSKGQLQVATEYGRSIAAAILEWSKGDGTANQYPPYVTPQGLGKWEPTPPAYLPPAVPQMTQFRTFVKGSTDNTLPPAPVAFSTEPSSAFYKMVKEVYDVQEKLTPEQKAIALFWDDLPDGKYYGGVGHWSSILRQFLLQKNVDLMKGSEAFVKMTIACNDAIVACWKGKYTYNLLRPLTYVTKYMGQPKWQSLIITPNHPEYPAAHATISMAAATALTEVFGPSASFTDHTYDDIGFAPRSFGSFEQAAREAGMSRLYGGIHYTPSIDAGYVVGKKTATKVLETLKPSFR